MSHLKKILWCAFSVVPDSFIFNNLNYTLHYFPRLIVCPTTFNFFLTFLLSYSCFRFSCSDYLIKKLDTVKTIVLTELCKCFFFVYVTRNTAVTTTLYVNSLTQVCASPMFVSRSASWFCLIKKSELDFIFYIDIVKYHRFPQILAVFNQTLSCFAEYIFRSSRPEPLQENTSARVSFTKELPAAGFQLY